MPRGKSSGVSIPESRLRQSQASQLQRPVDGRQSKKDRKKKAPLKTIRSKASAETPDSLSSLSAMVTLSSRPVSSASPFKASATSPAQGDADALAGEFQRQPGKRACFEDTAVVSAIQFAHLPSQTGSQRRFNSLIGSISIIVTDSLLLYPQPSGP